MENKDVLIIGIKAFFAVLPMSGALYLLGNQRLAIGLLLMIVPFTLTGLVMISYNDYMTDISRKIDDLFRPNKP